MNVLLFTTAMILLLGALTYARIDMYRSLSILQGQFKQYMEVSERSSINKEAENWYETSTASKSTGKTAPQKGKRQQALSRLSFLPFVNSEKKQAHSQEYPQLAELARRLFEVLYRDQKFYRENKLKIDSELLSRLMVAVEQLPPDQKITRATDLAILNLQDPILNDALYKMLQGTMQPDEKQDPQKVFEEAPPCQLDETGGEEDDEAVEPGKREEVKSSQGYYSLLDFITLQDAAKVRVYLAPRPLLTAIFDDPAIVSDIIATRCNLYRKLVSKAMTAEEATQAFHTQFIQQSRGFDDTILDFSVSKTNPRNYEPRP